MAGGKGIILQLILQILIVQLIYLQFNNDETNKAVQSLGILIDMQKMNLVMQWKYRSKYDYRKLGETWSTPRIIRIKVDGKDKWVAVFGGGYNGAVNPNIGSAVFVMDFRG